MGRVRSHVVTTVTDNPWLLLLGGVVLFLLVDQVVGFLAVLAGIWLWAAGRSRRLRDGRGPGADSGAFCSACGQPTSGSRNGGSAVHR